MIRDPLLYLVVTRVQQLRVPGLDPEQADAQFRELQTVLAEREYELFGSYLALEAPDFLSISPEVHTWFLEQFCQNPFRGDRVVPALTQLFYAYADPMLHYLIVSALLALDMVSGGAESTSIRSIWESDEAGTDWVDKTPVVEDLADLLLDAALLSAPSEAIGSRRGPRPENFFVQPWIALRVLARAERDALEGRAEVSAPAAGRIRSRAALAGGAVGAELRGLA